MNEPKQYWITDRDNRGWLTNEVLNEDPRCELPYVHVIEYSAYDALKIELEQFKAFYDRAATEGNAKLDQCRAIIKEQDGWLKLKFASAEYIQSLEQSVAGLRLRVAELDERTMPKLTDRCKHPGCCCVCGHLGLCPEDGPSLITGENFE